MAFLFLDTEESRALFHILDDGDGTVTLREFIDGLLDPRPDVPTIEQARACF